METTSFTRGLSEKDIITVLKGDKTDAQKREIFEMEHGRVENEIDFYTDDDGYYSATIYVPNEEEEPEVDEDGFVCYPEPIEIEFVWDEGEWFPV